MDKKLWYKFLGKEDAYNRSAYYKVNEGPIKLRTLLHEKTPVDAETLTRVKGISQLLKQFGFDAASKDVNAENYKTYAKWILKDLKGKIWLTDPISRKKTKWDAAEKTYNAFVKAFKSMGIKEIITPLDRQIDVEDDKNYILQRKTTGDYYAGGNIHTPEITGKKDEAATLSGSQIKNLKYNWPMSWDLIDLSEEDGEDNLGGEKVNEIMIPKDMDAEIKKSISMGFDRIVTGMISPKRKGIMLVNKKDQVRGTYDLKLKNAIQQMIDSKNEEINELSFTGETLNKVRVDVIDFLSKEHKKLGYTNPIDTYHLVQQVLDSGQVNVAAKKIR